MHCLPELLALVAVGAPCGFASCFTQGLVMNAPLLRVIPNDKTNDVVLNFYYCMTLIDIYQKHNNIHL